MSGLAELPRGLVTLEQWDALDLDEARRWELVEGGIVITPRPRPLHQIVSRNLTQLFGLRYQNRSWSCRKSRSRSRRGSRRRCATRTSSW